MKLKPKVQEAVNEQIKAEFESAYLYLAMSARFEALNLRGFAHWMRVQWQEETGHALKFFDFLIRRGGMPELKALAQPEATFETAHEAFEQVLEHERYITGRIHELYELARREHDYPLQTLLHWFIDEQVEEEEVAQEILDSLQLVEGDGPGLFMLDRELGARKAGEEEDA